MDNRLKGALALCTVALLLVGGSVAYALRSDGVDRQRRVINSGQLRFSDTVPGEWTDATSGTPVAIPDVAALVIDPGDVLTYRLSSTVRARGDNFPATLVADPSSISDDPELLRNIELTTEVSVAGRQTTAITGADDGETLDVVVTVVFGRTSLTSRALSELDLSDLMLTLRHDAR